MRPKNRKKQLWLTILRRNGQIMAVLIVVLLIPFPLTSQTIDNKSLDNLKNRAKETHSSALVIYQDDKLILNQSFDSTYIPLNAMSATKSFANLGIGLLITDGKLKSIDEPVCNYYPEWKQGMKKEITIRQLLNHTSGMQALRTTSEIYASPDYVQLALCAEISDTPGSKFFYNNKAVNLLAGIIQIASGMRMDEYINEKIFKPLEIKNYRWLTDSFKHNAKSVEDTAFLKQGNPGAFADLYIRADDMAKVGLLVLHKGKWKGKQIISESWFDESLRQAQPFNSTCGLLWWLIYDPLTSYVTFDSSNIKKLQEAGINDSIIIGLKKITGRFENQSVLLNTIDTIQSIKRIGGSYGFQQLLYKQSFFDDFYTFNTAKSSIIGYAARGYLGQYINVFPHKNLVVVRTISSKNSKLSTDKFYDFDILSYQLVK
jgi:CubicO group peptidase (beta-lactamase class C family)